jgi:hypothetical protein
MLSLLSFVYTSAGLYLYRLFKHGFTTRAARFKQTRLTVFEGDKAKFFETPVVVVAANLNAMASSSSS